MVNFRYEDIVGELISVIDAVAVYQNLGSVKGR
jgi:hypothetical protein